MSRRISHLIHGAATDGQPWQPGEQKRFERAWRRFWKKLPHRLRGDVSREIERTDAR